MIIQPLLSLVRCLSVFSKKSLSYARRREIRLRMIISICYLYELSGFQCRTLLHHAKRREIIPWMIIQPPLALIMLQPVFRKESLARSAEHYFIAQKEGKSACESVSRNYWLWWHFEPFSLWFLWRAVQNINASCKNNGKQPVSQYPATSVVSSSLRNLAKRAK